MSKRRSPTAAAMRLRHANTTTVMKDRRAPRGGARNAQAELMEGWDDDGAKGIVFRPDPDWSEVT